MERNIGCTFTEGTKRNGRKTVTKSADWVENFSYKCLHVCKRLLGLFIKKKGRMSGNVTYEPNKFHCIVHHVSAEHVQQKFPEIQKCTVEIKESQGQGKKLVPSNCTTELRIPDPRSQTHIFESFLVTVFSVKSSIIL
jgi:hypothetical protein